MPKRNRFIALLVLVFLLSCSQATRDRSEAEPGQKEVEQFIGGALPGDATNVLVSRETGIDTIYYIRFDASPTSVSNFTSSLGFTNDLREGYNPFPSELNPNISWWSVDSSQSYIGGSKMSGSGKVYEIMVDRSDMNAFRVYLRVYSV